jgi:hypothetical protein
LSAVPINFIDMGISTGIPNYIRCNANGIPG